MQESCCELYCTVLRLMKRALTPTLFKTRTLGRLGRRFISLGGPYLLLNLKLFLDVNQREPSPYTSPAKGKSPTQLHTARLVN